LPLPFIHPMMVAGTLMGSAPIIIHLLNRQRHKRVIWAAMHWLLASFKKSSRRLQIEDLILLIIRVLILVLLALALARPFLSEAGLFPGSSSAHRVVVLDTSFSMAYGHGGKSSFARAREITRDLVGEKTLKGGDAVTLVYMNDSSEVVVRNGSHLVEIEGEVEEATVSDGATDPVRALTTALNLLDESDNLRKEIFLVTDMVRNGWVDPHSKVERVPGLEDLQKAIKAYKLAHPDRRVPPIFVVDVGDRSAQNMAVSSLKSDVNVVAAKSRVVFTAEIVNYTDKDRQQLPVSFSVDGESVSSQLIDVSRLGGRQKVRFFHQFRNPGPHWVSVTIDSDSLPNDDRRFLAVPVVPSLRLLAVDGDEKADPLESETGLLSRALSIPVSESMVARGMESPSIIRTEVISEDSLNDAQLEDLDMVILANVGVVSDEKVQQFRKFVNDGGALLIFAGDNVDAELYNQKFYGPLTPGLSKEVPPPMLPALLQEAEGVGGNPDLGKFFAFAPDNSTSDVLRTFQHKESRGLISRPQKGSPEIGVRVFRRYRVKLVDKTPEPEDSAKDGEKTGPEDGSNESEAVAKPEKPVDTDDSGKVSDKDKEAEKKKAEKKAAIFGRVRVPLKYEDGQPAILIRDYGLGHVCLVTTTADDHWTDLPTKWINLPFMHDLVYHLVADRARTHNLLAGDSFAVKWATEDLLKKVTVLPPAGHEEDKKTVKPKITDNTTMLMVEGADWSGVYRLFVTGESEPRSIFATNVDSAESDLESIDPEKLQSLIKDLKFEVIPDREKIAGVLKEKSSGREFWRTLAWMVMILAVAESFLAWFFGRNRW
jgi:von Willebrand factor type A domain/Aerotolerance regulator N-terminal